MIGKRTPLLIMIFCLSALLLLTACGTNGVVESASDGAGSSVDTAAEAAQDIEKDEAAPAVERGKSVEEMLAEKNAVTPELTVDGREYGRKNSVSTYLFMGIDESGQVPSAGEIVNGGQCDTVFLVVIDEEAGQYTKVQLDRDMMVDMDVCDYYGTPLTTTNQQLCFAHSYGNGTETSCENVVRCISRLLGDAEIDGYLSLRYDGIPAANDAIGGISVKIEDDFSTADASLVMGETVELTGEHALNYIRGRMSVGGGTNAERMRRHRTYLDAFASRFRECLHGRSAIVNELYNAVSPYMVTNMSAGELTGIAWMCDGFTDCGTVVPQGITTVRTYRDGNEYTEFYADEAAMQELVLSLYYVPVDN